MLRIAQLLLLVGLFLCPLLSPAAAQATRTWISGVGDDVNPCSRTAPCKTFAGAISKTANGGEINCLDPGGFGGVTITKSITISCEAGTAGILVASTNAIIINAGPNGSVVLKGLDIEGLGNTGSPGLTGIRVLSVGSIHIEECVIRGFQESGIQILTGTSSKFMITRTTLYQNGSGTTGAGIRIFPSGGSVLGLIDRVVADRNVFGIAADGTGGTSGINITVSDSSVSGNSQAGIVAATGATGTGVMISRTSSVNNGTGLLAVGSGAVMRVGESRITGNGVGVSGSVQSYGTNQLNGNASDGTPLAVAGGLR